MEERVQKGPNFQEFSIFSLYFEFSWEKKESFFKKLLGKYFAVFTPIRGNILSSLWFYFQIYLENVHLKWEKCSQNFASQPLPISSSSHHCTTLRKVKRSEFAREWRLGCAFHF